MEDRKGKYCFHEKHPEIVFKVIHEDLDYVVLKQVYPTKKDTHDEYPMRYFENHFIATEPKN